MLVIVKERCFINNRIYEAGQVFDFDGPMPGKGIGPFEPHPDQAEEQSRQPRPARPRAKKDSSVESSAE